jgi:glycosyltransferase involved in cell wall biosynthesis
MAVVSNAVDLALFDAPPRERQQSPTVGFIFAQTPLKGADRCLRAIELARRQVPDLRVLAFGAQQPNQQWPLPPGTDFSYRPAQSLIPSLYAGCDIWLFPSRQDSFGLPILEAMACRVPVIGVPIGAAPDLLQSGGVLLSGSTDEDALCREMADAIVRLCRMPPQQWQAMSEAAYAQSRRYSWQDAASLFEGVLRQVAHAEPHTKSGQHSKVPNTRE